MSMSKAMADLRLQSKAVQTQLDKTKVTLERHAKNAESAYKRLGTAQEVCVCVCLCVCMCARACVCRNISFFKVASPRRTSQQGDDNNSNNNSNHNNDNNNNNNRDNNNSNSINKNNNDNNINNDYNAASFSHTCSTTDSTLSPTW